LLSINLQILGENKTSRSFITSGHLDYFNSCLQIAQNSFTLDLKQTG
jgi:hypothetical protein